MWRKKIFLLKINKFTKNDSTLKSPQQTTKTFAGQNWLYWASGWHRWRQERIHLLVCLHPEREEVRLLVKLIRTTLKVCPTKLSKNCLWMLVRLVNPSGNCDLFCRSSIISPENDLCKKVLISIKICQPHSHFHQINLIERWSNVRSCRLFNFWNCIKSMKDVSHPTYRRNMRTNLQTGRHQCLFSPLWWLYL